MHKNISLITIVVIIGAMLSVSIETQLAQADPKVYCFKYRDLSGQLLTFCHATKKECIAHEKSQASFSETTPCQAQK